MNGSTARALLLSKRALSGYFLSKTWDQKKAALHNAYIKSYVAQAECGEDFDRRTRIMEITTEMARATGALHGERISKKQEKIAATFLRSAEVKILEELDSAPMLHKLGLSI
ncbi:MAG: hypothetical protein AAF182_00720 [Pseudomonadota bacterium]